MAAVEVELAGVERERARRKPPESLNASECYQRGLWQMYRFTREDNAEAQYLFRRAVTLDPGFARGYAGFADSLYFAMMHGYSASHGESLTEGFEAAEKAVSPDGKDAGARFSLGRIYYMKRDHEAAIFEMKTAIALNPSFADAYYPAFPVRRHSAPHRPAQTDAGAGMTSGTLVHRSAAGMSAPKIWSTHPFHSTRAANRSSMDRNGLQETARSYLLARGAAFRHYYWLGRPLHGKSR